MRHLYVGAYTGISGGHGAGLTVLARGATDDAWQVAQVVEVDDPSFLVVGPSALHVVSETTGGRVLSWALSDGLLVGQASLAASGGAAPCHLAVDPASGGLVVANYVGGTVGVLPSTVADPVRVTRTLALPVGSGPVAERFKFTQSVGHLKAAAGLPASDPERERVQVARLRELAEQSRLDPAFAEKFLSFIVAEVIHHHEQIAAGGDA